MLGHDTRASAQPSASVISTPGFGCAFYTPFSRREGPRKQTPSTFRPRNPPPPQSSTHCSPQSAAAAGANSPQYSLLHTKRSRGGGSHNECRQRRGCNTTIAGLWEARAVWTALNCAGPLRVGRWVLLGHAVWCCLYPPYFVHAALVPERGVGPKGLAAQKAHASSGRSAFRSSPMSWGVGRQHPMMLLPGVARAPLCPLRTVPRREAGPLRRAVGAAAVLLVLGLLLVSHMSAPSPSELTMGVTSPAITIDGVTRPAVPSHPKSSGPPTQSRRATAGALARSVGVGRSAAKATATGAWVSWGSPSAWARLLGWCVAVVGLWCVWGWGGRPGPRWRMLGTTTMGKGEGLQAMAAQGAASVDASGVPCASGCPLCGRGRAVHVRTCGGCVLTDPEVRSGLYPDHLHIGHGVRLVECGTMCAGALRLTSAASH